MASRPWSRGTTRGPSTPRAGPIVAKGCCTSGAPARRVKPAACTWARTRTRPSPWAACARGRRGGRRRRRRAHAHELAGCACAAARNGGAASEWRRARVLAHVANVVPRVAVERLLEALLVEVVADEADRAAEDKEAVQHTALDVLVRLVAREGARAAEQVYEGAANRAVHVEDEVALLARRQLLDLERVLEHRRVREVVLPDEATIHGRRPRVSDDAHMLARGGRGAARASGP